MSLRVMDSYEPLARVDSVFDDCEIFWYHTELNGLPDRVTDADGQTLWRWQFSTWEKRSSNSAYRSGRCRRTCVSRGSISTAKAACTTTCSATTTRSPGVTPRWTR